MNTDADTPVTLPDAMRATRPVYWSLRREVWENRSIYMAPLIVAAVVLFASAIGTIGLPGSMRGLAAIDPVKQGHVVTKPYALAASAIVFTGFLVGIFYCLDALNSERRDRSILFWKSLPISDRTTVLCKAAIPLIVLPLFSFAVALIIQWLLFLLSSAVLAGSRVNPAIMWTRLPLIKMSLIMLYGLTAHVLWFAPIYGWLLLVSAWARRAVLLWALLPFFAIGVVERVAFGTTYFGAMLAYRFRGAMVEAFTVDAAKTHIDEFSQLSPIRFLTSAGLWVGLIFAAACLVAAVRLRRNREPI
jgi:ABC-2 type transport system permease protein